MPAPRLRPGINDIRPYVPGKTAQEPALCDDVHKLSANESALGPSPQAVIACEQATRQLHIYPEGGARNLRDAIASKFDIDPACVIAGAGSDEILCLLMRAYVGPGDSIVQTRHGFSMYHIYARGCGAQVFFAPEVELRANVDCILQTVHDTTRLVCLANPNNPTGTILSRKELVRLRNELRDDILLVIDGAYAEYITDPAYESGLGLAHASILSRADNVFATRTFSKLYGLGGLRLGWGYGPAVIITALHKIRGPFNVSTPAIAAGVAALRDTAFLKRNIAHNATEKPRLEAAMAALGFRVIPGHANFVLAQMPGKDETVRKVHTAALVTYLEARGIFIRAMDGYFLPDFIRVTVGPKRSLTAFEDALQAFMAENNI